MNAIVSVVLDCAIPVTLGVLLLVAYRRHPERFPRRFTPLYMMWMIIVLILGSVLMAIWNTYNKSR